MTLKRIIPTLLAALVCFVAWHPREAHATACTAGCVQYEQGLTFSGSPPTVTVTGVAAGNSIHVFFCIIGPTAVTSVTVGGSSATVGSATSLGNSTLCGMAVRSNVSAGSNDAVVNVTGGACAACFVWAEEWSGDASSSPLDAENSTYTAGSSSTPLPCGSISPVSSGDTIEVVLFQADNVAPTDDPSGYSVAFTYSTYIYSTYKTSASSGSQNPTFTSGASSVNNSVICAAFVQSGGPVTPAAGSLMLLGVGR